MTEVADYRRSSIITVTSERLFWLWLGDASTVDNWAICGGRDRRPGEELLTSDMLEGMSSYASDMLEGMSSYAGPASAARSALSPA